MNSVLMREHTFSCWHCSCIVAMIATYFAQNAADLAVRSYVQYKIYVKTDSTSDSTSDSTRVIVLVIVLIISTSTSTSITTSIACTSPTFWPGFFSAVQTEIPYLCTTKLCRFYEAVPPSPASHELRICKMSVWCPCWPLLPLDRANRLVVMALYE